MGKTTEGGVNGMKKIIGWPLCQILYYVGHLAYLFLDRVLPSGDGEPGPLFRATWAVYHRSMIASGDINDWAGLSVWRKRDE